MEGASSEETGRRPDLGRASRREGEEEGVSEIMLLKKQHRELMVERWRNGRCRWTGGVDVEDASTIETPSCTILR